MCVVYPVWTKEWLKSLSRITEWRTCSLTLWLNLQEWMRKELIMRISTSWAVVPWKAYDVFLHNPFFYQRWNFMNLFSNFWCYSCGSVRNVQALSKLLLTSGEHKNTNTNSAASPSLSGALVLILIFHWWEDECHIPFFAIFQGNFEQNPIAATSLLWNEQAAYVLLILLSLDHLQNFRGISKLLSQELWELLILQTPRGFKSYSGDIGPTSECDVLAELRKITALVFFISLI